VPHPHIFFFMAAETKKWSETINAANIKAD
jgi:hypothetical protein